jgi:hypothetical protein
VGQLWIDANIDGPFGSAAAEFNEADDLAFDNNALWVCRFAE